MYKNSQAFTKAASFSVARFVVHTVYKYISLNCRYDMSSTANKRTR